MNTAWSSLLVVGIFWPLVGMSEDVQWTEKDWLPLVDEPSRQELLQLTVPKGLEMEALPRQFVFPADTFEGKAPRKNSIFGIDISHHNKSGLPFQTLISQNVRYVYAKATQGVTSKDPKFASYWRTLEELPPNIKPLRGAYHFMSSNVSESAALQAERFVAYVNLHGGFKKEDLPPTLDLEWDIARLGTPDRWRNRSPKEIVNAALAFLERVEELTGKIPMLYTARSWWRERGIPESEIAKFARYPIWVADFSRSSLGTENPAVPGKVKPALWQFSDKAKLSDGYPDGVDANLFQGTEEEFMRTFFEQR